MSSLYFFRPDYDLTFEFIQLRNWLIDIGCPMSLVYRISRWFYWDFDFDWSRGVGVYQLQVRRFIFGRLDGYVLDSDFRALEGALFGGGFGGILQRMWAFRGFKLNGVSRMDCGRWFRRWVSLGYNFDITTWSVAEWEYEFTFDFGAVVLVVPEIEYDFDNLQDCLVNYLVDQNVDDLELQRYKLTIDRYITL